MQKYPYSFIPVESVQEYIALYRDPVEDLLASLPPPVEMEIEPTPQTATSEPVESTTGLSTLSNSGVATGTSTTPVQTTNPRDTISNTQNKFNVDLADIGVAKAPPGQLKSFLSGLILRDDEFKAELSVLVKEVMAEELELLRQEITQISSSLSFNLHQGTDGEPNFDNPVALKVLEKEFPGCPVRNWTFFDEAGTVNGTPGNVSVNLVNHGGVTHICQLLPTVTANELDLVLGVGKLYKSQYPGGALSCVVITSNIDQPTNEVATKCKIRVIVI